MDNFRAAMRSLLAAPGTTLIVILTIAVAIGANTAIFSVVSGVLMRPLYTDDDDLVVVWTTSGDMTSRLSPADYRDMRDTAEAFAGQVLLYRSIGSVITSLERPVQIGSMAVTPRVFDVLGIRPTIGQLFTDADGVPGGPAKVVLTHASWVRRFGADPALIGQTIDLDGEPRVVVGVTEPGFQFPPGDDHFEAYFPMALSDGILLDRDHRMFDAVARLADGNTLSAAQDELNAIASQLAAEFPDTNEGWGLTVRPLREEVLGNLRILWVLAGAVFLVLLIACANIANVLVARSLTASREYAVRAALGAGRADLWRRSFAESGILALVGGTAGVLAAMWGIGWLRGVIPADIPRADEIGMDARVLLFAIAMSLGACLLFGILPALRSTRPDLAELLKPTGGGGGGTRGGRRLRAAMVVVEVAMAIVLLVGAGLMVRSFARLSAVDPGFRTDGVVAVAVKIAPSRYGRAQWRPFFEQLVERVRAVPGVDAVGAASDLPMSKLGLGFQLEFTATGLDAEQPTARPNADVRLILPGYFEAMGTPLVRGRTFDDLDTSSARPVGVINETLAARYFTELDPLGRSLDLETFGEIEIIGVVADVHNSNLQSKFQSEIFVPYGRVATAEMHIVVQSDLGTAAVASAVADVVHDLDPELAPSAVAAMSDLLWESAARPRFNAALLSALAACAALLAAVGTYGVVAYLVSQRTSEIGVRMALGASAAMTVRMIVREALGIVLAGVAIGFAGALGATQLLRQALFDVQVTDPQTYSVVMVGALVVGVVAAWIPARRATRIDPVAALRDG